MTEQWQELKETITELRDNNGTGTQQEICKFLINLMDVLERQMVEAHQKTRNKNNIENAILFHHKEIAHMIFENEYMSKTHDDYNKEHGKIATYDEIIDLINGQENDIKQDLNYADEDTLIPAT